MDGLVPRISGVGTGVPPSSYTQEEVLERIEVPDERIRSVFLNSGIARRHLVLPGAGPDGWIEETQKDLLAKHSAYGLDIGRTAIEAALKRANAGLDDVGYLCCVSSTGFMTPGFSALLIKELGMRRDCARVDVVGMGCNAGLNALNAVAGWVSAHPGELALMVCIEVCSAAYAFDGTMRTSVVNSLFGDGAAALALTARRDGSGPGPAIENFASWIVPDAVDAMRYDWDDEKGRFSFYLDRDVPYVVGANVEEPLARLLEGKGLRPSDIAHWIIHSGGKKVIDSVRVNLGLTRHDVRHTTGVLRDYGNLSSGSFLFSYERLLDERVAAAGDYGVMMTMGPGSTVELALIHW
ncbi:3,5-dihydroxyphenylacetyl-CoA synthase DpgA [Streptomyces sp. ALI-76-A]|uniref:3,5-dihydroxyphenylacetyl-CoA synthase DpgA n=1 Tax=Streptomyces sp. ALI-76-A TaxID=3025736 RepID=UPI00256F30F8|nr:3,5-dihydroxyphenylacetyl-CoA synthase DpgA [Streptomyces sp. ALI-76-A]MDL5199794.1 type III polyketide synthase [Streptomyces sp. ALI-76-A]